MADLAGTTSSQTADSVSPYEGSRGTNRIVEKVRDAATAQLTSQKDRATDGLGSISQAVRQSTHQLRDQEHDVIAHYIEQAADQIDRLSQRLRDRDVGELVDDIQQVARRRPALFIGGAFAVGLIGARFFKSSNRSTNGGTRMEGSDLTTATADRGAASAASTRPTRPPATRSRRSSQSERA
jgi:hypothetical protein